MTLTSAGLQLLKTLEGCSLLAYLDPPGSGSWSIGYGHNSPEVAQGQHSSQQQADAGLPQDVALSPQQRDALISFCFNVGAGEPVALVLKEELARACVQLGRTLMPATGCVPTTREALSEPWSVSNPS